MVRIYGCAAALTKVEATAEGSIDGQRRSVTPVTDGKLVRTGTKFANAFTDREISAALME